ncbi:hypothetical protein Gotur_007663 [Gossypium turneri]
MNITGMSKQWITARIKQKGDCNIYSLVVFPKALGYIDEAILTCSIELTKGSHLSQQSWPKLSDP